MRCLTDEVEGRLFLWFERSSRDSILSTVPSRDEQGLNETRVFVLALLSLSHQHCF